ncbi:MAG: zf-HC2 domain-containing protein [Corynebacterium sp.]|uniref:anti-sigma factor family protein n=1 Tax=Corynebacterium sp. TaxID=1720 RepID=UPI0026DB1E77|nr:zf-HC2 domain-containing protein [Corynebacterium sp.]MDO5098896.1 zf-HC2 domain-containing protein [Corynebacterium sp.]
MTDRTSSNPTGRDRRAQPTGRNISAFIQISATTNRIFASTDHLHPEAVAAFVDNELSDIATHRAQVHLVHCPECRQEVERQRRAAKLLRESCAAEMKVAPEFMQRLMGIAHSCPDGPCAEETFRQPETILDKIDLIARAVRRSHHGK